MLLYFATLTPPPETHARMAQKRSSSGKAGKAAAAAGSQNDPHMHGKAVPDSSTGKPRREKLTLSHSKTQSIMFAVLLCVIYTFVACTQDWAFDPDLAVQVGVFKAAPVFLFGSLALNTNLTDRLKKVAADKTLSRLGYWFGLGLWTSGVGDVLLHCDDAFPKGNAVVSLFFLGGLGSFLLTL